MGVRLVVLVIYLWSSKVLVGFGVVVVVCGGFAVEIVVLLARIWLLFGCALLGLVHGLVCVSFDDLCLVLQPRACVGVLPAGFWLVFGWCALLALVLVLVQCRLVDVRLVLRALACVKVLPPGFWLVFGWCALLTLVLLLACVNFGDVRLVLRVVTCDVLVRVWLALGRCALLVLVLVLVLGRFYDVLIVAFGLVCFDVLLRRAFRVLSACRKKKVLVDLPRKK